MVRNRTNLDKFRQGFIQIIREELESASQRVPLKISANCPVPALKGYFGGKYIQTPSGGGFQVYTTFPKPIAVYVTEFGRPGLPRRDGFRFPAGGYPLKVKRLIKKRAGQFPTKAGPEKPSRKELEKFQTEGVVIRPGPIAEVRPKPFIRPTWKEEYSRLLSQIYNRIKDLARRCEI